VLLVAPPACSVIRRARSGVIDDGVGAVDFDIYHGCGYAAPAYAEEDIGEREMDFWRAGFACLSSLLAGRTGDWVAVVEGRPAMMMPSALRWSFAAVPLTGCMVAEAEAEMTCVGGGDVNGFGEFGILGCKEIFSRASCA